MTSNLTRASQDVHKVELRGRSDSPARSREREDRGVSQIECSTGQAGGDGACTVVSSAIPNSSRQVSFAPTSMTLPGHVFQPAGNHDPDGSSNGWSIVVRR